VFGQGQNAANVVSAGQLGHHTTIGLVHIDLAMQGMAQQHGYALGLHIHQGDTGFIARRFNTQHTHGRKCKARH
jgi:hypothetical protein